MFGLLSFNLRASIKHPCGASTSPGAGGIFFSFPLCSTPALVFAALLVVLGPPQDCLPVITLGSWGQSGASSWSGIMLSPSSLLMGGLVGGARLSSQRPWCKHRHGHGSIHSKAGRARKHLSLCQEPQEKGKGGHLRILTCGDAPPFPFSSWKRCCLYH